MNPILMLSCIKDDQEQGLYCQIVRGCKLPHAKKRPGVDFSTAGAFPEVFSNYAMYGPDSFV